MTRINKDNKLISKRKKVITIRNPPLTYIIAHINPMALNVMYSYHAALCSKCQVLGIADALWNPHLNSGLPLIKMGI
jgi:hypothetical protein